MNLITIKFKIKETEESISWNPLEMGVHFGCECGCGGTNYTLREWEELDKELDELKIKLKELKEKEENWIATPTDNEIELEILPDYIIDFQGGTWKGIAYEVNNLDLNIKGERIEFDFLDMEKVNKREYKLELELEDRLEFRSLDLKNIIKATRTSDDLIELFYEDKIISFEKNFD